MQQTFHTVIRTAMGYAALAYTIDPVLRLEEVVLPRSEKQAIVSRAGTMNWRREIAHPELNLAVDLIRGYFDGEKVATPWQWIDTGQWTPSQEAVYRVVASIPYAQVRSYGEVSRLSGNPRAARFVGNCMARNPYPVLIPCHRVICSDGQLGGFGGGALLKRKMLQLEGVAL